MANLFEILSSRLRSVLSPKQQREQEKIISAATDTEEAIARSELLPVTDPVIFKYGTSKGIGLYQDMERLVPMAAGLARQIVDAMLALPYQVLSGDPNDEDANEFRDQVADAFERIKDRHIFERHAGLNRFFGYSAGLKLWDVMDDGGPSDGLIAPKRILTLDWPLVDFRADNTPVILSRKHPKGIPIPPENWICGRWGSTMSPRGLGDYSLVYEEAWKYVIVAKMMLEQLETVGRPIMHWTYPAVWNSDRVAREKNNLKAAGWKVVVPIAAEVTEPKFEFPNTSAITGMAGEAALAVLRKLEYAISVLILGTDFDQGGEAGARAKNQTYNDIRFEKLALMAKSRDEMWNEHWFAHVCEVNRPDLPRSKWPYLKTDAMPTEDVVAALRVLLGLGGAQWQFNRGEVQEKFGFSWEEVEEEVFRFAPNSKAPSPFRLPSGNAPIPGDLDDLAVMSEEGEVVNVSEAELMEALAEIMKGR